MRRRNAEAGLPQTRLVTSMRRPVPSLVLALGALTTSVGLDLGEPAAVCAQTATGRAPTDSTRETPRSGARPANAEASHRCRAGVRLVGSVMNVGHPERSKAALRNKNGTRVMGPGQRIDNLTLLAVWPTSAILRNAHGEPCYIPVYLPREERPLEVVPAKPAAAPRAKAASVKREPSEALKRGVREVGPGRYVVTREALMQVLGNSAALVKSAGVRPLIKNGQSLGMQLVRLRPESPLRLLGLEKGDVLRHLNGHSLSTPGGMLEVVRMLRSSAGAVDVMLGFTRKDVPVTLSVAIR